MRAPGRVHPFSAWWPISDFLSIRQLSARRGRGQGKSRSL